MKLKSKLLGAAAILALTSGAALAGPAGQVTPPGERAGLDLASPLPEGVYFIDIPMTGNWRNLGGGNSSFDANVPIIAWATPWTILGGRIQLIAAAPEAAVSSAHFAGVGAYARGIYNPFVAGQIAFNLGNGFSVSYLAGAYIGVTGSALSVGGATVVTNPFNQTTFHQQLALAYHMNGWNATANIIYGMVGQNSGAINVLGANGNYFNYDLGLTKTIGKWEVGIVGAGSNVAGYGNRNLTGVQGAYSASASQFALGGLIGYNFGPVITQFTLMTDLTVSGYTGKETIGFAHIIVPLWNPEAPKAVAAKY